jgi:Co/Zn/Cd efflux system component
MVIGSVILIGGAKIIRESYYILMESVPEKFDLDTIRHDLTEVEGVVDVHDMHLWTVTSDHYSFTGEFSVDFTKQPSFYYMYFICILFQLLPFLSTCYMHRKFAHSLRFT